MVIIFLLIPLTPVFLDIIRSLNESHPWFFVVAVQLRVDQEKYYVPIFCYNISIIVLGAVIMVGVDTMYVVYTVHACSLFSIIRYVHLYFKPFCEVRIRIPFHSQQFEKILSELDITKQVSEYECCLNEEFELLSEKEIYQQYAYIIYYIICFKKYQLALE